MNVLIVMLLIGLLILGVVLAVFLLRKPDVVCQLSEDQKEIYTLTSEPDSTEYTFECKSGWWSDGSEITYEPCSDQGSEHYFRSIQGCNKVCDLSEDQKEIYTLTSEPDSTEYTFECKSGWWGDGSEITYEACSDQGSEHYFTSIQGCTKVCGLSEDQQGMYDINAIITSSGPDANASYSITCSDGFEQEGEEIQFVCNDGIITFGGGFGCNSEGTGNSPTGDSLTEEQSSQDGSLTGDSLTEEQSSQDGSLTGNSLTGDSLTEEQSSQDGSLTGNSLTEEQSSQDGDPTCPCPTRAPRGIMQPGNKSTSPGIWVESQQSWIFLARHGSPGRWMWARVPEGKRGTLGNTLPGSSGRFYGEFQGKTSDPVRAEELSQFFDLAANQGLLESPNAEAIVKIKENAPTGLVGDSWWGMGYHIDVVDWEGTSLIGECSNGVLAGCDL